MPAAQAGGDAGEAVCARQAARSAGNALAGEVEGKAGGADVAGDRAVADLAAVRALGARLGGRAGEVAVVALGAHARHPALGAVGVVQVGYVADAGAAGGRREEGITRGTAGAGARLDARGTAGHHGRRVVAHRALTQRVRHVTILACRRGFVNHGVNDRNRRLVPGDGRVDRIIKALGRGKKGGGEERGQGGKKKKGLGEV